MSPNKGLIYYITFVRQISRPLSSRAEKTGVGLGACPPRRHRPPTLIILPARAN